MEKWGAPAFEFLHARGAIVTATDLTSMTSPNFRPQTDELLDEEWDLIGAVPRSASRFTSHRARHRAWRERHRRSGIGRALPVGTGDRITGTNGKTTRPRSLGHIRSAKNAGTSRRQHRIPVIAMTETSRKDQWNVLELSSFHWKRLTLPRRVSVCLNVTQNHLDRHRTFANYAAAKSNLFRTQKAGDFAVLNADDEGAVPMRRSPRPKWSGSAAGYRESDAAGGRPILACTTPRT